MANRHKKADCKPKKDNFVVTYLEVISRKGHADTDGQTMEQLAGDTGVYCLSCGNRPLTKKEFREVVRMVPADIITPNRD